MPSLKALLENGTTANGTRMLLTEIRKHQKDMPEDIRDDMTFGALLVLYEMGKVRGCKLAKIEKLMILYAGLFVAVAVTMLALHGDIPWLTEMFSRIFGT